jgi:hypothetical protein
VGEAARASAADAAVHAHAAARGRRRVGRGAGRDDALARHHARRLRPGTLASTRRDISRRHAFLHKSLCPVRVHIHLAVRRLTVVMLTSRCPQSNKM